MTTETVTRQQGPDRFEITSEGQVAGFLQFVDEGQQRILFHTEVGKEFGGRGLAGVLVREALEQTRTEGLRAVAMCPYVAAFVKKNEEFADLVDPVTPALIQVVERSQSES